MEYADNTSPARTITAFWWLRKTEFRDELKSLSIQRRLMNCALRPHLGRDGTDLDAVLLTPDGQLCALEFKRKYPSVGKQVFGLDEYPHIRTIRTMDLLRIRNLHIILVSPVWDKKESPVDWLNEKKLNPHWTWLAASLKGEDFPVNAPAMHTSNDDSGQRKGEREQGVISWDKICLLNKGLKLDHKGCADLVHLLIHGTTSDAIMLTYEDLVRRKQR